MKRALRKRAKRLLQKAEKSIAKKRSDDFQSLSVRLSKEQYCTTLREFCDFKGDQPGRLAVSIAKSLIRETETLEESHVPQYLPEEKAREIDCGMGCAWCCHEPLQVSILDAVSVAAHLSEIGEAEQWLPLLQDYCQAIEPLGRAAQDLKESFEPCPFLDQEQKCGVYEARPVICRAFHSTDVKRCKGILEEKQSSREVPMFTPLFGFRGLRLSGARKAIQELGLDDRPVVLARAVKLLLENFDEVLEDWLEGESAFEEAAVE